MADRIDRVPRWVQVTALALAALLVAVGLVWMLSQGAYADEPNGTDRYFAEGNTLPEFDTYLAIQNPGECPASVKLEFVLETGEVVAREVSLLPRSRSTVALKSLVPPGHSGVSAHVHSDTEIVVERPMYFTYRDKWTGGSASSGQAQLQESFYFAEGTTRNNPADGTFETWLCLQNPGTSPATVNVEYLLDDGQTLNRPYSVPPHSRRTVEVAVDIGLDRDCGIVVTSDLPIACERPMYFDYHGVVQDGSSVVGAPAPATKWYFAEGTTRPGFDEWITILNPTNSPAEVTARWLTQDRPTSSREYAVGAKSRRTVNVNQEVGTGLDLSGIVESDVPVVVERSVYSDGSTGLFGGDSTMGVTSPSTSWQFAEGTTIGGFVTYYCLLNPDPTQTTVTLTYQFRDGEQMDRELTLPANSRITLNLAADIGTGRDVAGTVTSNLPIVAERPMYFSGAYRGATVGSGVMP